MTNFSSPNMDPRSNLYRKPASASQSRTHPSPSPSPSISTSSNSDQAVSHPNLSTSTASNSIHSSTHSRVPSPVPPNLNHNLSDPSRRWPRASKATLISPPPRYDSYQSFGPRLESPNYMNFEKQHLGANSGFSQWPLQVPNRPLIERVTNRWQSDPKYKDLYHGDYDDDDDYAQFMSEQDESLPICSWPRRMPRRALRYLFVYLTFLLCVYSFWHFWFHPAMEVEDDFDRGMSQSSRESGAFGINVRPEFADMLQVQYLDSKFVPGATHGSRKRLVVVGDVHGCKDELLELLEKISFNKDSDHLVLAGDMIFKGPDSNGVIELLKSLGGICVRGNHEDRTILAYASMHSSLIPLPGPDEDPARTEDNLSEESFSHGDYKHRALAKELGYDQIKWLQQCPVILHVGKIGGQDYVVVHAGLTPGVSLEKQDPFQVMNMRTIDLQSRVPSEGRMGEPWEKLWNHHQSHIHPPSQRTVVIYGHDSNRGLNIKKYSKGLDSGCVRGGKLSAIVIDERGREKTVSIKCENHPKTSKPL